MGTEFYDMHSGGSQKLEWGKIYIELPEKEAVEYFETKFDRYPYGMTCSCCGPDYHIDEYSECPISASTTNILIIRKEEL
ncbi:MAG TPA: hypothetical protein VFM18_04355 [Methanosarcina sp.]|nr:hypothetical protein [Methanosarcina sp.]